MEPLLMPVESIRYTSQGDYACSWCGYLIPTNKNLELMEWCSYDVAGLFCGEAHAIAATNNITYRSRWQFNQ